MQQSHTVVSSDVFNSSSEVDDSDFAYPKMTKTKRILKKFD
jgi:hypothetical protein